MSRWAGAEVVGVSLVTNPGAGITGNPLTHEEVLDAAAEAGGRFQALIRSFVRQLAELGAIGRRPVQRAETTLR